MQMCSRCHKRVAVVYISHMVDGKMVNDGLCMKCAKELGIQPVNDIIENMGLSEEDIDNMSMEMDNMLEPSEDSEPSEAGDESEGRAPSVDFNKIFGQMKLPPFMQGIKGGAGSNPNDPKAGKAKGAKNGKQQKDEGRKFINLYCMDLTAKARQGKLDKIVGRDREISRMMQILCRRQKNNPCLIGEPGVGKTAIAEALAQKIANGSVPYRLKDKEIMLVDLTALVAGTQFRGQFESRMKGLISEVKALGNIILVIDEVHSIVGAGDAEGSMNAANILKPALSRGDVQIIGATTLTEYRKYIEKDSALERRFQPIIIEESSVADTVEILGGIKSYYENFHGISVPFETVRRAVYLSERYITERYLPDKAIDLLDEACAHLVLKTPVVGQCAELKAELEKTERERAELEAQPDPEDPKESEERYKKLADLKVKEIGDRQRLCELEEERAKVFLSTSELADVIEIWTGIPASNITEHEFGRIDRLADRLKSRIVGQDEAVDAVARAIKRSRAGISYKRKPVSFIFAGPTGVGKTELVKTLASDLFDSPESLIRLDMSEFMEKHSVSRIIGSPPGYVGYDEAGQLTEKIRRKPYSVVLFDEIEKAHPDVLNVLLQILDDGRITDAQGRCVSFENTIIAMTTNAGSQTATNAAGFGADLDVLDYDKTMKALSDFLRPEFINRVDEVISFHSLTEENFVAIANIMLSDLKKVMEDKEIEFGFTDRAAKLVASKSYSRKFGARNMRRYIERNIEDKIADKIISSYENAIHSISVDVAENGLEPLIICN
ncbi:MAG: ATP-dependent Clp protease ATP-binding subunit [Clostridia bacterium]|nr:ATP-dependent Clp protease ATP-binding subunit [Clostridia bacterium]